MRGGAYQRAPTKKSIKRGSILVGTSGSGGSGGNGSSSWRGRSQFQRLQAAKPASPQEMLQSLARILGWRVPI